MVRIIRDYNNW